MLNQLAHALLPHRLSEAVKRWRLRRRRRRQQALPRLSEEAFRTIRVDTLGVHEGAVVFVHSSVGNMNLDFPVSRIVPILQELVGEEGTLLFPCTHVAGRAEDYLRRKEIFDVRNSVTTMGIVPELARRTPGAVRSPHPTNSVVALGKRARELTQTHVDSIYPCGELSPYYKIVSYNGLILGLGVSTASLSFVHCIEDIWQHRFPLETRTRQIFDATVLDEDGRERIVRTLAAHQRIAWRNVPAFIRRHIPKEACCDLKINGVDYFVARSGELYTKMEELSARGITIYLKKAWRS